MTLFQFQIVIKYYMFITSLENIKKCTVVIFYKLIVNIFGRDYWLLTVEGVKSLEFPELILL